MSFLPAASAVDLQAPYLLGFAINVFLCGILAVQVDAFVRRRTDESGWLQVFVGILTLLSVAESAGNTAVIFTCFFSPLHLVPLSCGVIAQKAFTFVLICDVIIAVMAQSFFMLKAYKITASKVALAVMGVLIIATAATQLLVDVLPFAPNLKLSLYINSVYAAKSLAAATDVTISAIFIFKLSRYDRSAMFASTDTLVTRLRSLSLQTASVTSVAALLTIILTAQPTDVAFWGILPNFALGKLYAVCTLHVLNHRKVLQSLMSGPHEYPIGGTSGRRGVTLSTSSGGDRRAKPPTSFRLTRSTTVHPDDNQHRMNGIHVSLETISKSEKYPSSVKSDPLDTHELPPALGPETSRPHIYSTVTVGRAGPEEDRMAHSV